MSPESSATPHVCPPDHRHGATCNCYRAHGCRCLNCRAANSAYVGTVARLKAYGRWDRGQQSIAPVAVHIIQLQRFGYSYDLIAHQAGVSRQTVYRCATGLNKYILGAKAKAILAVKPTLDHLEPHSVIDATGARRRIQALGTLGWNNAAIARHAGVPANTLGTAIRSRDGITVQLHRAIDRVYEELWNTPAPASTPIERRDRTFTLNRAARAGWAPPLAWDDIDTDPEPQTGDAEPEQILDAIAIAEAIDGNHPHLTRAERLEALKVLHGRGHWDPALAELLDVSAKTIERDREHLGLESNYLADMEDAA